MEFLRSLIQDLENGKQSAHKIMSLIQQLQGSDGVDHRHHDHEYYYKGFDDHSMVVLSTLDNALSKLQRCDLFNDVTKVEYSDHSTLIGCKVEGGLTPKSSTPKDRRGCSKRRKIGQSDTVIITPNLTDDGYAWRKYGQKNILNEKYPRNYYRCTHKIEQGCQATKQVQQISEKPDQYRVIYQGEHTCKTLFTKTPLIIPNDDDHQNSSFVLSFNNPTTPKHALNPLIFPPSPSPPPSSTLSPSPSQSSSSSSSPFAMVKQEYYVPIKDGVNQSYPSDLHQSSDMISTSTTTAFDQGDVISSSIDVQGFYSSGVAYHGMDNDEFNNMMDDLTVFDEVMLQDILCV